MQAGGILGTIIALVATVGFVTWWIGGFAVRACGRLVRPVRLGEGNVMFRVRLGSFGLLAAGAALALVIAAAFAFVSLLPSFEGNPPHWLERMGWLIVACLTAVVALIPAAAVANGVLAEIGAFRRRRILLGGTTDSAARDPAVPVGSAGGGRRIVICCDGTGNRPDDLEEGLPATTNVWKIYRSLIRNDEQTAWYDPGVGTDTSSTATEAAWSRRVLELLGARTGGMMMATFSRIGRVLEGATGVGITENIAQAYAELVKQYRPGDKIYLVGFSRGAYTVRCVAGVISRGGLLRAENIRFAADLVQLYRTRADPRDDLPVPASMIHPKGTAQIEFLGLFDTVGSLGVPLWGWWFRALPHWKNQALSTDPMPICRFVYHAMAMDERRSQFFPTPFNAPATGSPTQLEQVWFRGAHADVGGGYAETGLSDIALGWMVAAAKRHGLVFRQGSFEDTRPDPVARLHDELSRSPSWRLFGSWPRWHPVPDDAALSYPAGRLHPSVIDRMHVSHQRLGRPDFLTLDIGKSCEVDISAQYEWHRTGIVLQRGWYRLTYLGGEWRDGEQPPCGPFGRRGRSIFHRRMPGHEWTRLCAAVAHPRQWPLREGGFFAFLKYLFWKDPDELLVQVAPIGKHLRSRDASVYLHNAAGGGLLYFFANDLWLTAANNSGAVRLRIECVASPTDDRPIWRLDENGRWAECSAEPACRNVPAGKPHAA